MIGGITPPAAPAGYIPPEIITGDTDRLVIGLDLSSEYEFPSGTKIRASQEKKIEVTAIPGGKGTVKELTGFGDWSITIEFTLLAATYGAGILAAPSNPLVKSMIQKIRELKKFWETNETLYLNHSMLNALGIKNVVCKSFDLPDGPIQYSQSITLTFLSDEEYDLDLASVESKNSAVESSL
ncbi:DUF6046 domain-containing protein [Leptospira kmetyi]|uniref:DUF6046 domain-containing protein n=1 Tax=Leptospira kmetyi TaxID=408139 RepID=A0A2M9XPK1_9LEPT|nr:DUF6046 domain-containing protein [Leptospira kmetyi]AYV56125.1 hypothetical protein EFP84_11805 [Leptospira kmetyi]PJZ28549.1 hypothetical protein CH378_17470 [Leptospira kmetyi]PJZ41227.1 hypothetical protein CH370_13425 [Leptospira kmetyi]TGK16054.1 hypothetical protein EHO62_09840 [Leptospira kmetyi]TGK32084.1 hypothetical protein EHO66_06820 [Leptospira kmetyi]